MRALWVLLAWSAVASLSAQEVKCPAQQGKSPLVSVSVYDGAPSENADLKPDESRGAGNYTYASWDVGYLYDMGRSVSVVCRYKGAGTVTVKINHKVNRCIFRSHGGGQPADFSCK